MKAIIDYQDGQYSLIPAEFREARTDITDIPDNVWQEYENHLANCARWHNYIKDLDNKIDKANCPSCGDGKFRDGNNICFDCMVELMKKGKDK